MISRGGGRTFWGGIFQTGSENQPLPSDPFGGLRPHRGWGWDSQPPPHTVGYFGGGVGGSIYFDQIWWFCLFFLYFPWPYKLFLWGFGSTHGHYQTSRGIVYSTTVRFSKLVENVVAHRGSRVISKRAPDTYPIRTGDTLVWLSMIVLGCLDIFWSILICPPLFHWSAFPPGIKVK